MEALAGYDKANQGRGQAILKLTCLDVLTKLYFWDSSQDFTSQHDECWHDKNISELIKLLRFAYIQHK